MRNKEQKYKQNPLHVKSGKHFLCNIVQFSTDIVECSVLIMTGKIWDVFLKS